MTFLLMNWRWIFPTILCGLALAYGTVERMNYIEEKAARVADIAQARQAILLATQADAARTRVLTEQAAQEKAILQQRLTNAQITLSKVGSVAACANTPASRAFDDSVRLRPGDAPGAGAARSAGPGAH